MFAIGSVRQMYRAADVPIYRDKWPEDDVACDIGEQRLSPATGGAYDGEGHTAAQMAHVELLAARMTELRGEVRQLRSAVAGLERKDARLQLLWDERSMG